MFVSLKPRAERSASAAAIIRRLDPELARIPGVRAYLQATQDINVGGRLASAQYQFTLQDADASELNDWAPRILETLRALPQLRDVASDQQTGGTTMTIDIDRDAAGRYGITPLMINNTLYGGCRGIERDARRGCFRATHRGRRAPAFPPVRLGFGPWSRCFRCFLRGGQSPGAVCGGCGPRHRVATRRGSVRGRAC